MVQSIINNIRQCDDFHNRCDYLLEHDEATHLIEYITELEETNKQLSSSMDKEELIKYLHTQLFNWQTGWFTQDMETTIMVDTRIKVYKEILNILEEKDEQ